MRWQRTLTEMLHLAAAVVTTAALFAGGAWGYPQGRATIWAIGYVTMAAVALLSLPALLRAMAADREGRDG